MDYRDKIGEIPEDWEAVKANKHLVLESGMRPSQHVTDNVNDIPSLGGENVHEDGYLVFDNVRYISREYFLKMPKGKIIDGDILINKDGANTGKIAFAKWKPFPECAVNEHLFIIRNTGDFNQDFLFYFLFSEKGNVQIQKKVVGSAQGGINNSFPKGIFLPKPPKPEQTAIATLLSKVDEAIAATQNSIKAAEKLKKALMQNLLTGKLKPDGSWRSEDEFYEDEKFGKVPLGWEVKKLKDVFFVNQNSLPSQTDGNFTFRYITIEAVQTENIEFESCPEYAFKDSPGRARRIINDNDILISGVRPNLKAFAIYQKPNDENWICSTGFYVLSAKDDESHKYHFYQILSEIGEKQFHSYVAGSNYPAIGDRDLKLLKLLRPPYDEQCLIEEKISSISIENSKKQVKIQTLQRLKKSLMQNLLTGKVRLPQEFIAQFEEVEETIKS